jgi:hypothetical protein
MPLDGILEWYGNDKDQSLVGVFGSAQPTELDMEHIYAPGTACVGSLAHEHKTNPLPYPLPHRLKRRMLTPVSYDPTKRPMRPRTGPKGARAL